MWVLGELASLQHQFLRVSALRVPTFCGGWQDHDPIQTGGCGTVIALLQRVAHAQVRIAGQTVGQIGTGLLGLIAVQRDDSEREADRLLERVLNYRVFPDEAGKMNLSVRDIRGGLLLVSQFTLAADTSKGNRPGFSNAAAPDEGRRLFAYLVDRARALHAVVATGEFGAHMQVELVNDGPVTFWIEVNARDSRHDTSSHS
jgi:D-tyrosyl-tRNA(Tyr) deacylase